MPVGDRGAGALAVGATTRDRTLFDLGTVSAAIHGTNFARNFAEGPGGAIRLGPFGNAAVDASIFVFNAAKAFGGALAADAPNPCAIANTTLAANFVAEAVGGGGALSFGSDPSGAAPPAGAASVLRNVTVVNNTLVVGDGGARIPGAKAAGVLVYEGELLFDACHFAGNHNRNLEAPDDEDDVCAFGAQTTALFKAGEKPAACSACGGAGACV